MNEVVLGITSSFAIAGEINNPEEWKQWANGEKLLGQALPKPALEVVPGRISRRLNNLGRCVMAVSEQLLPSVTEQPAIIAVSRHGDLPFMDKLIACSRSGEDISPTQFTYSVHNRLSSLVSMFAGYKGVNAAYSSVRDGFPLALAEAHGLLHRHQTNQVLLLGYEPEIPLAYENLVSKSWRPHVVGAVLSRAEARADQGVGVIKLRRYPEPYIDEDNQPDGSALPFYRALLNHQCQRQGQWEYCCEN